MAKDFLDFLGIGLGTGKLEEAREKMKGSVTQIDCKSEGKYWSQKLKACFESRSARDKAEGGQ